MMRNDEQYSHFTLYPSNNAKFSWINMEKRRKREKRNHKIDIDQSYHVQMNCYEYDIVISTVCEDPLSRA